MRSIYGLVIMDCTLYDSGDVCMNKTRISKSDCSCNISIELAEGEKPPIKCPNCGCLWSKKPNMNKTTEETMEYRFDEQFTLCSQKGKKYNGYLISEEEHIKRVKDFIRSELDSIRNDTLKEVEEVYKGEDYERYEADITYNAYNRKTGKYDVTEIAKGIKRWMRFKINSLKIKK